MLEGVTGVVSNLSNVFTVYNMLVLLAGVAGGLILGALPGVSPTLSVALLVPFTFYMDPASGLILLGAVYTASVAGGAISAILINVPGAPANIATLLDGYPLAKSGKAESTLYTCFVSSFIGGVFGMAVMILLTFPLAEFALKFKSVETFWVAVLGLTVVAGLGQGSILKALIAGSIGVWLSTVGANPTTGEFRFIFHDVLTGGINVVAALIGLFAIPQVFSLIEGLGQARSVIKVAHERGTLMKTIVSTARMFKVQSMGSVIGAIIGLIPGVGGQVAGIVSYDQVKKFSRKPESFGKGNPEGVAAAESANNAMVGPSLVPLLVLSIPGSPTAAVLLGGLLIHGIFPGPNLFLLHGSVVNTFIASLLVAQLAMMLFGLVLSRYSGWVMKVPDLYMAGSIIVLAVFGTYSINNNFNDIIVMFGVGAIMYVGSRFGFSAAPVVMGLILGDIAENSFLKGLLLGSATESTLGYFFSGWINITLIFISVASIAFGIISSRKDRGQKASAVRSDIVTSVLMLFTAAVLVMYALRAKDPLSEIFPVATLAIMGGLSLLLLAKTIYAWLKGPGGLGRLGWSPAKIALPFVLVLVYFYTLNVLGFYASSFMFHMFFVMAFTNKRNLAPKSLVTRAATSAAFVAVLFVLFNIILKVSPPKGLLF